MEYRRLVHLWGKKKNLHNQTKKYKYTKRNSNLLKVNNYIFTTIADTICMKLTTKMQFKSIVFVSRHIEWSHNFPGENNENPTCECSEWSEWLRYQEILYDSTQLFKHEKNKQLRKCMVRYVIVLNIYNMYRMCATTYVGCWKANNHTASVSVAIGSALSTAATSVSSSSSSSGGGGSNSNDIRRLMVVCARACVCVLWCWIFKLVSGPI